MPESVKWLVGRLDDTEDGVGVPLRVQSSLTVYDIVPVLVSVSRVLNSEGYSSVQDCVLATELLAEFSLSEGCSVPLRYDVVKVLVLIVPVRLRTPLDRVSPLRGGDAVVGVVSVPLKREVIEVSLFEVVVVSASEPVIVRRLDSTISIVSSVANVVFVSPLVNEEVE